LAVGSTSDVNLHDTTVHIISIYDGAASTAIDTRAEIGYITTASDGNINTAWTNVSDKRLKTDIKDTTLEGLNIVNAIKLRDFKWSNDSSPSKKGKQVICKFIADELYEIFPYATVGTPNAMKDVLDEDGNKIGEEMDIMGVTDGNLVAPLVKAIQELSAKVTALENA
jgi:hypothetical protein